MARPAFKPTSEQRTVVEEATKIGLPQPLICRLVRTKAGKPISEKTLRKYFKEEIADGSAHAKFQILNTAFSVATDPENRQCSTMNIWYQKTQLGMSEKTTVQQLGADGEPITPGPLAVLIPGKSQ